MLRSFLSLQCRVLRAAGLGSNEDFPNPTHRTLAWRSSVYPGSLALAKVVRWHLLDRQARP